MSLPVKLGCLFLPALISTPDLEGIELYSLLMSHGEKDSLHQEPIDSTLTVSIIPSQRANGTSSKKMTYFKEYLKYYKICLRVLIYLVHRVF